MGRLLEMPRRGDGSDQLNPQQRIAVEHRDGPMLIVAGAGTGKTRVITERIRYLLDADPDLPGEAILGLTFTDKAAAEMQHRVNTAGGERGKAVWLGTFHKFCLERILLEVNPGLKVLDEVDYWIFLRRHLQLFDLKHYRRVAEPGQFLRDFCQFFSRCQDELVSPDDYDKHVRGLAAALEREKDSLDADLLAERAEELARQQEVARVYHISDKLLREKNLCTFGMQLLEAVRQLQSNEALLEKLRGEYRYILVDEFQDTNIAQLELLALLTGERRNIVVVGDDDQAIYRFRGASFGSFQIFAQKFMGAAIDPQRPPREVLLLRQNYRSTARILKISGHSIAMNADRMFPDKRLETHNPAGERITVAEFPGTDEEAFWVAEQIVEQHRAGRRWRDFAVLYRMHVHREKLIAELRRRNIPFVIRNLTILSNPLVRDIIAYLRLIARPWDHPACARVLAMPAWGVEPDDLARLCERARTSKGLWEAVKSAQDELPASSSQRRLPELVLMIEALNKLMWKRNASDLLDELTSRLGLVLVPEDAGRKYLDTFANFVRDWRMKTLTETGKLREFIDYLEMFEEAGGQITLPEGDDEDAVQLGTVHAAKGLEYEHVFVLRLTKGWFPSWPRRTVLEFPAELMKEVLPQGDFHVQEERRLFYVAITRARQRLTLTTVVSKRNKPSPFLEDFLSDPLIKTADVNMITPRVDLSAPPALAAKKKEPPGGLFGELETMSRLRSRIVQWALRYRPPVLVPLKLSASSIGAYDTCPQRFLFERGWGIKGGARASLTFGNVMHAAVRFIVQQIHDKRELTWPEVAQVYEAEWKSRGFEDDYQEEEYKKEGVAQLQAFFESYRESPGDMRVVEEWFELPMENDIVVTGRLDQLNNLDGGGVEVLDYKTGKPKDEKEAKKSLQLSIYAMATRQKFDVAVERVTLYSLTSNESVSATRTAKDYDAARAAIAEVADNVRAGNFPPQPGFHCRNCDYKILCPAHEQTL